jgi:type IV pilus assembly protein PilB
MSDLNDVETNLSTAEDPIEFNLMGINQVQMHEDIGLNFAASLRSFLRQDPDIIMVGEIRDFETAEIAVKAALTGHLVLSTLHTNDAPSTVTRLLNMGVEPFLVTASVNLVLAQRLARKICQECKVQVPTDEQALLDVGFPENDIPSVVAYRGSGCKVCSDTGYKGRVALYECMPFNESLREIVLQGGSTAEVKSQMIHQGVATLRVAGLQKVVQGVTTIDEIVRVTASDA